MGRGLTATRERFGLRRALVVTQVALSLVLLLGSLLFTRTLFNLLTTDPGFNHEGAVVATVSHLTRLNRRRPRDRSPRRLAAICASGSPRLPDVASVAQADIIPLGNIGFWNENVSVDGASAERRVSNFNRVSDGFFRTLDIPFVAGRDFDERDTLQSPPVAIVSDAFVKQFLPDGHALGRIVRVASAPGQIEPTYEIVGVVKRHAARESARRDCADGLRREHAGERAGQRHGLRHQAARARCRR